MPDSTPTSPFGDVFRSPRFWPLQLAAWTGFSLVALPLKLVFYESLRASLLISAYQLPLAVACSAGLRWFFRRLHVGEHGFTPSAFTILVACLAAGGADVAASVPLNRLLGIDLLLALPLPGVFAFRAAVYLIWSLGYLLLRAMIRSRTQAFQFAVGEERHRLELLRYQLNPNFLAQALATIAQQIEANPGAARTMAGRLGDFYQNSLRNSDSSRATTIGDELALIRAYLDIEQLRLRECLRVTYEVDDSLLPLPLPPALLLPLAERAILAAGGTLEKPLQVTVAVRRAADGLIVLEVGHTGRLDRSQAPFAGAEEPGVAQVRTSLERHFAGRYRFDLSQDSFFVRATVSLPLTA